MIRLAVRCAPEYADAVMANLLELAPNGLEEERGPGWVEFAIYGPPGEVPDVGEVQAAAGGSLVDVTTTAVPDDWADKWTDFHRPIEVSGRVGVRPSWWEPKEGLIDVVVDPGRAFGTGGHPTTRLCLGLLVELEEAGEAAGPIADWGTGSGVLGIAAAKLGWSPITGCHLTAAGEAPARLVCSGMLGSEVDEVVAAFASTGLSESDRRIEGDWGGLLLRSRPGS